MHRLYWALVCAIVAIAAMAAQDAGAQPYYALEYWGGPVLEHFTIYPLYYGDWSQTDIDTQQAYLKSLAAYISGEKAPAGEQPVIRQYGVMSATVAAAKTASPAAKPNAAMTRTQVENVIASNQKNGKLPAFGPSTLIAVFLAHGFELAGCDGCAYHASNSTTAYWLVVPHDTGAPYELSTAHEVFESATDPVVNDSKAWGWLTGTYTVKNSNGTTSSANDEFVDECGGKTITLKNLGIQIPEATDNTAGVFLGNPKKKLPPGGSCSTTGYTSLAEIQVYGWSLADLRNKYDTLWTEGWRLYILQGYVLANGEVAYNAVWRPSGNTAEIQGYGVTKEQFIAKYNQLWPLGWRIYILDTYVKDGATYYNAVWRPGDLGETQDYEDSWTGFNTLRTKLYSEGWRPISLEAFVDAGATKYNAVWRPGAVNDMHIFTADFTNYKTLYNTLWQGNWRLYLLQSYLDENDDEVFDAVFHPGNHGEIQIYGATYAEYRAKYDALWPEGWRLYILQSFLAGDGTVHYNAVWRQSTIDRPM